MESTEDGDEETIPDDVFFSASAELLNFAEIVDEVFQAFAVKLFKTFLDDNCFFFASFGYSTEVQN